MPKWMPCNGSFVVGDVYRWTEPVWKPKRRKNARAVRIGERRITAQLAARDGDWLEFLLMDCETANAETWWKKIPELPRGKPLRRAATTLLKRNPERRPWGGKDGEQARAIAASRFLR